MVTSTNVPRTGAETLRRILAQLPKLWPNLRVEKIGREVRTSPRTRADATAEVRIGNLRRELVIEAKASGEPRIAEQAIGQLRERVRQRRGAYGVFAAPFVSERSRELCRAEGIGYVDLEGDAYLQFASVLVDRVGPGARTREKRGLRSILAPKATRVLRALLSAPSKATTISGLAEVCEMSPAGVYLVAELLEAKGYVTREKNRAIRLEAPGRLLRDWAENWSIDRNRISRYFSFGRDTKEILESLERTSRRLGMEYALTGISGAHFVAPFVRSDEIWAYVRGEAAQMAAAMDLRPVSSGANLVLLEPYDAGVFQGVRQVDGTPVVSDVQLYVDLLNFPGRGREQAERLREQTLAGLRFP